MKMIFKIIRGFHRPSIKAGAQEAGALNTQLDLFVEARAAEADRLRHFAASPAG